MLRRRRLGSCLSFPSYRSRPIANPLSSSCSSSSSSFTRRVHSNPCRRFTSTTANVSRVHNKKKLPLWFGIFPASTFGLGTWQIYRWRWKQDLKERRQRQVNAPVEPLPPSISEEEFPRLEYRKFECRGTFLHDRQFRIHPRTKEGVAGYLLVTPFRRTDGSIILVNRGWAPSTWKNDSPNEQQPKGVVSIVGMLRPGEKAKSFVPDNQPERGLWFWLQVDKMAKSLVDQEEQNHVVLPLLLDLVECRQQDATTTEQDFPQKPETNTELRDQHLNYVATWYTLTAALVTIIVLSRRRAAASSLSPSVSVSVSRMSNKPQTTSTPRSATVESVNGKEKGSH
ncbi:surf-like protein [Balamuthia mandrillaris]